MLIGAATLVSGLGSSSACRVVAANPVVQAVGALIVVGSIIYGVDEFPGLGRIATRKPPPRFRKFGPDLKFHLLPLARVIAKL